ncbi:hypothetical protein BpHYR1_024402 [Brachionus plicatilis]|uniref:Uncharacterized protein n=1 Tax=Brachionus plicatilis TaxID=10195 RepID=A0A3M7QWJ1_BRAPC|nr:hypothetical protein BpHYR1_024402 [Brachionus plicatilis]
MAFVVKALNGLRNFLRNLLFSLNKILPILNLFFLFTKRNDMIYMIKYWTHEDIKTPIKLITIFLKCNYSDDLIRGFTKFYVVFCNFTKFDDNSREYFNINELISISSAILKITDIENSISMILSNDRFDFQFSELKNTHKTFMLTGRIPRFGHLKKREIHKKQSRLEMEHLIYQIKKKSLDLDFDKKTELVKICSCGCYTRNGRDLWVSYVPLFVEDI